MSRPMWIPLESNPEVFNSYANSLGCSTSAYAFTDIWGLDPDLLSFVPKPVKAVLLLFPTTEARHVKNKDADAKGDVVLASEVDDVKNGGALWIPQTIGNACGTMGMCVDLYTHMGASCLAKQGRWAISKERRNATLTLLRHLVLDPDRLHALANSGIDMPEESPLKAFLDDCKSEWPPHVY